MSIGNLPTLDPLPTAGGHGLTLGQDEERRLVALFAGGVAPLAPAGAIPCLAARALKCSTRLPLTE